MVTSAASGAAFAALGTTVVTDSGTSLSEAVRAGIERAGRDLADTEPTDTDPTDTEPAGSTAAGERHVASDCSKSIRDYTTVVSSCSSGMGSYVTVRARLCSENHNKRDCFAHEGDKHFIVAYNPDGTTLAHGFSRRQAGSINLV